MGVRRVGGCGGGEAGVEEERSVWRMRGGLDEAVNVLSEDVFLPWSTREG